MLTPRCLHSLVVETSPTRQMPEYLSLKRRGRHRVPLARGSRDVPKNCAILLAATSNSSQEQLRLGRMQSTRRGGQLSRG